jgi:hypothetical protein
MPLSFKSSKFHPQMEAGIKALGYDIPTPIQRQTGDIRQQVNNSARQAPCALYFSVLQERGHIAESKVSRPGKVICLLTNVRLRLTDGFRFQVPGFRY